MDLAVIPTRQKTDALFEGAEALLAPAAEACLRVKEVRGYAFVNILAFSDQPFTIRVEEGCACAAASLVPTQTLSSTPSGALHVVCERVAPCGTHMRLCYTNTGPAAQGSFDLCGRGLPLP